MKYPVMNIVIASSTLLSMYAGIGVAKAGTDLVNTPSDFVHDQGSWTQMQNRIAQATVGTLLFSGDTNLLTNVQGQEVYMDGTVTYYIDGTNRARYFTLNLQSTRDAASCAIVPEKTNLDNLNNTKYSIQVNDAVDHSNNLNCNVVIKNELVTIAPNYDFIYTQHLYTDNNQTQRIQGVTKTAFYTAPIYDSETGDLLRNDRFLAAITDTNRVAIFKWDELAEKFVIFQSLNMDKTIKDIHFYSYTPDANAIRHFLLITQEGSGEHDASIMMAEYTYGEESENNPGTARFMLDGNKTITNVGKNISAIEIMQQGEYDYLVVADAGTKNTGYVTVPKFYWYDATPGKFLPVTLSIKADELPKGPKHLRYFNIGDEDYLAVTSHHGPAGYDTESYVYKVIGGGTAVNLVKHTTLPTNGAQNIVYFTKKNLSGADMHYIAVANSYSHNENVGYSALSRIYYLSGGKFEETTTASVDDTEVRTQQWVNYQLKYSDNEVRDYLMLVADPMDNSSIGKVYSWVPDATIGHLTQESKHYLDENGMYGVEFIDIEGRYFFSIISGSAQEVKIEAITIN